MSPTEIRLWRALRLRPAGLRFHRQHPIGPFVLDFYCKVAGLAIEVDGLAHDFEAVAQTDLRRDEWLRDRGVQTIRISVEDIRTNLEGVILHIAHRCLERTPPPHFVRSPSPSNAGEAV